MDWLRSENLKEEKGKTYSALIIAASHQLVPRAFSAAPCSRQPFSIRSQVCSSPKILLLIISSIPSHSGSATS